MKIFDYDDYKKWVRARLESMPKAGRGQLRKIAEHLGASPTIVTQVFSGDRELTPEQSMLLAEYFALSKMETRFLILLVNYSRAGSHRYQQNLKEEIGEVRALASEISSRVVQNFKLTDEAKSVLYSNWYYLAMWSLTAIEGFNDLESISKHLQLNRSKTRAALDFLLKYGLIVEDDQGRLRVGPTMVHLESQSPQISRHHQNWRLQAFARYENPQPDNLTYTGAATLSAADAARIREKILNLISESAKIIETSPSEELHCICIDWFRV